MSSAGGPPPFSNAPPSGYGRKNTIRGRKRNALDLPALKKARFFPSYAEARRATAGGGALREHRIGIYLILNEKETGEVLPPHSAERESAKNLVNAGR